MDWAKNITDIPQGSYRSISGYAAEQAFIARAEKAGFNLFFKVWRDLEYDAVLDSQGTLFRIEVKSTSSRRFDFTRGGRAGIQIDRNIDKTRLINRQDCDFIVGVDINDFTCYIIPAEYINILGRKSLSYGAVNIFREKWDLFLGGKLLEANNFSLNHIVDGFFPLDDEILDGYLQFLEIPLPLAASLSPPHTRGITISDPHEIRVLTIWNNL